MIAAPAKPKQLPTKTPPWHTRGRCPRCGLETIWRGMPLDRPPCPAEGCGYRPQSKASIERTDARISKQYQAQHTKEIGL